MKASLIMCTQSKEQVKRVQNNIDLFVPDIFELVPVYNAKSIAKGYNEGARRAKSDILVFAHDDIVIRFGPTDWNRFMLELKCKSNGIGGVAGFRKIGLNGQGCLWPPVGGYGSGGCLHEAEGYVWYTTFGIFGRSLTLDGIFLAMRREVFKALDGFDTEYPGWHWYDIDITFRSHLLGLKNFTYPLLVQHGTTNFNKDGTCVDQKEFFKHANLFWKKYGGILPQEVECSNQELENRVFSREPRWGQVKEVV